MIHIVEKLNNGQMIVKCENIIDADILVEYIDKYYDTFSDEILVNIYNILFNDIQHIIKKYTTVYISANGFLSEFSFDFFILMKIQQSLKIRLLFMFLQYMTSSLILEFV